MQARRPQGVARIRGDWGLARPGQLQVESTQPSSQFVDASQAIGSTTQEVATALIGDEKAGGGEAKD